MLHLTSLGAKHTNTAKQSCHIMICTETTSAENGHYHKPHYMLCTSMLTVFPHTENAHACTGANNMLRPGHYT